MPRIEILAVKVETCCQSGIYQFQEQGPERFESPLRPICYKNSLPSQPARRYSTAQIKPRWDQAQWRGAKSAQLSLPQKKTTPLYTRRAKGLDSKKRSLAASKCLVVQDFDLNDRGLSG